MYTIKSAKRQVKKKLGYNQCVCHGWLHYGNDLTFRNVKYPAFIHTSHHSLHEKQTPKSVVTSGENVSMTAKIAHNMASIEFVCRACFMAINLD